MPMTNFDKLPDDSRVWVFSADRTLNDEQSKQLLDEVDRFLPTWTAHGAPLTVGRDWRYARFLTIAVDQSSAGASGCSIDGLFRTLKSLEPRIGASLVTSGLVFFRDQTGAVQSVDREKFTDLGAEGKLSADTTVFDPTVTTLGEWRARFELPLRDSWHAKLIRQKQPA
ncbi:MAG TPA: hypothetical protein VJ852_10475 [Gemmatimonadaceae bacterium]|nr:hypothetical protein [Gemmatimonadaceae bacterium]